MWAHTAGPMTLCQAWNNLQGSLKASSGKKVPEMTTTVSDIKMLGAPGTAWRYLTQGPHLPAFEFPEPNREGWYRPARL